MLREGFSKSFEEEDDSCLDVVDDNINIKTLNSKISDQFSKRKKDGETIESEIDQQSQSNKISTTDYKPGKDGTPNSKRVINEF